jgi:hypothetical protein
VHAARNLIAELCAAMESYRGNGDPNYLRPMAQAIKQGVPTWEDVLIRTGAPWTPYVTSGARRGANKCIADATAYIPSSDRPCARPRRPPLTLLAQSGKRPRKPAADAVPHQRSLRASARRSP